MMLMLFLYVSIVLLAINKNKAYISLVSSAGATGLEPATFCVTGRRSNQLSYHPVMRERGGK